MRICALLIMLVAAAPAFGQERSEPTDDTVRPWLLRSGTSIPNDCRSGCSGTDKDGSPFLVVDGTGALRVTLAGDEKPEPVDWSSPTSVLNAAIEKASAIGWAPLLLFMWLMVCLRFRSYGEIALDDVGNDSEHWDDGRNDGGQPHVAV